MSGQFTPGKGSYVNFDADRGPPRRPTRSPNARPASGPGITPPESVVGAILRDADAHDGRSRYDAP